MQPADEVEKNRGTYHFGLIFAIRAAPHLRFLHFHVFDKPAHASFVARRAYGALSLWQAILFLSHRLPHLCVRDISLLLMTNCNILKSGTPSGTISVSLIPFHGFYGEIFHACCGFACPSKLSCTPPP